MQNVNIRFVCMVVMMNMYVLRMGKIVTMSWKGCIDEKITVFT